MITTLPKVTCQRKSEITHGNVTAGNVCVMSDEFRAQWREQGEPHARLKWARIYWQKRSNAVAATAADAANSLGWKAGTYRAYEREPGSSKATPLDHQAAIEFGRRFGVNWRWLLLGQGTPFDEEMPAQQARVLGAMAKASEADQSIVADMIEAYLRSRLAG